MDAHTDSRFTLSYRDERGKEHETPLSAAARLPFFLYPPIRKPRSRPTQGHLSGYYWFSSSGTLVPCESGLEMTALMRLDFSGEVASASGQPFRLEYPYEKSPGKFVRRFHVPDFFVRRRDGEDFVVNVKRKLAAGKPDHLRAAKAMRGACGVAGWGYEEMYEPEEIFFSNLAFLAGYRRPPLDPMFDRYAAALIDLCAESSRPIGGLLADAATVGPPAMLKPALFHLLWRRVLETPLRDEPLSRYAFVSLSSLETGPYQ